jgi:RNA polymerase sigma factor (sigma-70 family)
VVADETPSSDGLRETTAARRDGAADKFDADITALLEEEQAVQDDLVLAEKSSFAVFYKDNIKKLLGFTIRLGAPSVAVAEDIVHTTMLTLYERWDAVEHPAAWAYKAVTNAYLRTTPSGRGKVVDYVTDDDLVETASPLLTPEAVAEIAAEAVYVADLLAVLPEQQRMVMAWRMEEAFDDTEIAKALRTTPKAVRAAVKRARATLKKHLHDERTGRES